MENDKIDLKKHIVVLKRGWIGGIISFVVVLAVVISYCAIKMPVYNSSAMMLIEDDKDNSSPSLNGGIGSFARAFSIGGFGTSSVDNELVIVKSNALKKAVASRLGLNRTYIGKKGFKKEILYKKTPICVDAPTFLFDTLQVSFKMRIKIKDDKVDVAVTEGLFNSSLSSLKGATLPCSVETPYGVFRLLKTENYVPGMKKTIDVIISGDDLVAANMDEKVLNIDYRNKKADIIELNITDVSKDRGRDILNSLMMLYNEKRKGRRDETAEADINFLDERISQLAGELSEIEGKIATFKSGKNLVSIETEASLLIHQDKKTDEEILLMKIQRSMLEDILKQLNNPEKKYSLIPMAETLGDGGAAVVIGNYNTLILKRLTVTKSAKSDNVVLKTLTDQIDALRETVIENVNRTLDNLQIKYASALKENNKYKGRLNVLPKYEQEYIDLMRDKELINSLYVVLLEKRESAMLKVNNNKELGFVFEPAYSAIKPDRSKLYLILGCGVIFAMLFGCFIAFIFGKRKTC